MKACVQLVQRLLRYLVPLRKHACRLPVQVQVHITKNTDLLCIVQPLMARTLLHILAQQACSWAFPAILYTILQLCTPMSRG